MKKISFAIIGLIQYLTAFSGPREYYANIWLAEKSIMDGNIALSCQYYKSAFESNSPLRRDTWTALACELLGKNDKNTVQQYILWSAEMDPAYFFENLNPEKRDRPYTDRIIFNGLVTPEYLPFIAGIDKSKKYADQSKIGRLLSGCLDRDSHIRDSLLRITNNIYDEFGKEIKAVDDKNVEKLKWVLESDSPIDEMHVGTKAVTAIRIITLHNIQWDRNDILPLLKERVIRGEFDPRIYAYLHDKMDERKKQKFIYANSTANYIENDVLFLRNKTNTAINGELIDQKRSEIFLEPYEQLQKKIKWCYKNQTFNLYGFDIYFPPYQFTEQATVLLKNNPDWQIVKRAE